ncbi:MAG: hypothetical protein ABI685_00675 [Ferruginibacter sp.]
MKKTKIAATLISFLIAIIAHGQNSKTVTEYLNVPGPITINNESFSLAWSSHPSATYYKQEYIGAKDKLEHFKKMVLVEVLTGNAKAADLAQTKIAELKQMKLTNPIVNYEVFQKNGEYILDFLLSENTPDGKKINILERNVYRYKEVTDKNGKKAVMLFGASERAYGNDADTYLSALKKTKSTLTNAVAAYVIPQLTIKK